MRTPSRLLTFLLVLCLGLVATGTGGCRSRDKEKKRDFTPVLTRLHLEAGGDVAGMPVQLPLSGSTILVNPKPVFGEFDVVRAEVVRVDLGFCIYLQLNAEATRDFYRMSLTNRGRRLVVSFNGAVLGARMIDQPVSNGALFFFLELPDEKLPELAVNISKTSEEIIREGRKARGD